MRSADELRERWVQLIPVMMDKTGMFASTGREMELSARRLLGDLCFLDGREAAWEQEWSGLVSYYGKLGVSGPFVALFGSQRCPAEVASVFAEVFCRFGTSPSRTRSPRGGGRK